MVHRIDHRSREEASIIDETDSEGSMGLVAVTYGMGVETEPSVSLADGANRKSAMVISKTRI